MKPFNCPSCSFEIHYKDEPFQCWGFSTSCPSCKVVFWVIRSRPCGIKLKLQLLGTPHVLYKEPRKRYVRP
jgi:hypothetical protein